MSRDRAAPTPKPAKSQPSFGPAPDKSTKRSSDKQRWQDRSAPGGDTVQWLLDGVDAGQPIQRKPLDPGYGDIVATAAFEPPMPTRASAPSQPRPGLVQRSCACGGPSAAECTCARRNTHSGAVPHPFSDDAINYVPGVISQSGAPLDTSIRAQFEPRFGADFSRVRVHTDAMAAASAHEMTANAYVLGSHVVFASGRYQPGSTDGRRLIAHELAHVVQQGDRPPSLLTDLAVSTPGDRFEQEADAAADRVMSGQPAQVSGGAPPALRRQPDSESSLAVNAKNSQAGAVVVHSPPTKAEQRLIDEAQATASITGLGVPVHPEAVSGIHDWDTIYGTMSATRSDNVFFVGTFHLLQLCTFDASGTPRVYVYYVHDVHEADRKYAVGPDSLMTFVALHGGSIVAKASNTDQIPKGPPLIDPRQLPAAPDAFRGDPPFYGPQMYYVAPRLPAYDDIAPGFKVGVYDMRGYLRRRPDGSMAVLYYVAQNMLSELRPEYIVGPGDLALFTSHVGMYQGIAAFSYPLEPGAMPPAYAIHSARYVQGVMSGDSERASEGVEAWKSAAKDPGWWFQVVSAYAGAAEPQPAARPPDLKVVRGGGGARVPVSAGEPLPAPVVAPRVSIGPGGAARAVATEPVPVAPATPTPAVVPRPRPQPVPGFNPTPAPVAARVAPPSPSATVAMMGAASKLSAPGSAPAPRQKPGKDEDESKPQALMRFQVQWNSRAKDNQKGQFSEIATASASEGVTTTQAVTSLNTVHAKVVPKRAQKAAAPAVTAQINWVNKRPPQGIATGGVSRSAYFEYDYPDARVDVENVRGHNLKR